MIIVEHIKNGNEHSDGNASLIGLHLLKYPTKKIHLFSGLEHYNSIINILKNNNINYSNIIFHEIRPFGNFVRDYKLIIFDFKIAKMVFDFALQENINDILFLYTSTFLLYYVKYFSLFYKFNIKMVLHGDLERIDVMNYAKSFDKGKIIQFFYALLFGLKIPLNLGNFKNLNYIVYSESIKNNAVKILPKLKKQIIAIPHPYFYQEQQEYQAFKNNKLRLCVVGLSSMRKNIPSLKYLIDELNKIKNLNISIIFAGKIIDKKFLEYVLNINFIEKFTLSNKSIATEIRDEAIKNSDYALLTYKLDSYKLIANGAFMDAINYEKPVLAIRNNYIENYFNKYGNIGYMFETIEDLLKKINDIRNNFPIDEYNLQVQNIRKIKQTENINYSVKLI